jgi:hypothetical protein
MATIEEIERHDALIRAAEAQALLNLAAHLREAVIDLPVDSPLARAFVRRARTFEVAAQGRAVSLRGDGELWMLGQDLGIDMPLFDARCEWRPGELRDDEEDQR